MIPEFFLAEILCSLHAVYLSTKKIKYHTSKVIRKMLLARSVEQISIYYNFLHLLKYYKILTLVHKENINPILLCRGRGKSDEIIRFILKILCLRCAAHIGMDGMRIEKEPRQ